MAFFEGAARRGLQTGLIFVDGNHDFEFAIFDIQSAARFVVPGGLIVVDNIAQPGPYYALLDFLSRNPDWRQIGRPLPDPKSGIPFDRHRAGITNTDFAIVRAPRSILIGSRPTTNGYISFPARSLMGVRLTLSDNATGTLNMQFIMRSFEGVLTETIVDHSVDLEGNTGDIEIRLPRPFEWTANASNTAEPWFVWKGESNLKLVKAPQLF